MPVLGRSELRLAPPAYPPVPQGLSLNAVSNVQSEYAATLPLRVNYNQTSGSFTANSGYAPPRVQVRAGEWKPAIWRENLTQQYSFFNAPTTRRHQTVKQTGFSQNVLLGRSGGVSRSGFGNYRNYGGFGAVGRATQADLRAMLDDQRRAIVGALGIAMDRRGGNVNQDYVNNIVNSVAEQIRRSEREAGSRGTGPTAPADGDQGDGGGPPPPPGGGVGPGPSGSGDGPPRGPGMPRGGDQAPPPDDDAPEDDGDGGPPPGAGGVRAAVPPRRPTQQSAADADMPPPRTRPAPVPEGAETADAQEPNLNETEGGMTPGVTPSLGPDTGAPNVPAFSLGGGVGSAGAGPSRDYQAEAMNAINQERQNTRAALSGLDARMEQMQRNMANVQEQLQTLGAEAQQYVDGVRVRLAAQLQGNLERTRDELAAAIQATQERTQEGFRTQAQDAARRADALQAGLDSQAQAMATRTQALEDTADAQRQAMTMGFQAALRQGVNVQTALRQAMQEAMQGTTDQIQEIILRAGQTLDSRFDRLGQRVDAMQEMQMPFVQTTDPEMRRALDAFAAQAQGQLDDMRVALAQTNMQTGNQILALQQTAEDILARAARTEDAIENIDMTTEATLEVVDEARRNRETTNVMRAVQRIEAALRDVQVDFGVGLDAAVAQGQRAEEMARRTLASLRQAVGARAYARDAAAGVAQLLAQAQAGPAMAADARAQETVQPAVPVPPVPGAGPVEAPGFEANVPPEGLGAVGPQAPVGTGGVEDPPPVAAQEAAEAGPPEPVTPEPASPQRRDDPVRVETVPDAGNPPAQPALGPGEPVVQEVRDQVMLEGPVTRGMQRARQGEQPAFGVARGNAPEQTDPGFLPESSAAKRARRSPRRSPRRRADEPEAPAEDAGP